MSNKKSDIRKDIRSQIRLINDNKNKGKKELEAKAVIKQLLKLEIIHNAQTVFSYLSFGNELGMDEINEILLKRGVSVYVPLIRQIDTEGNSEVGDIEFHQIDNNFKNLPKNRFGIREPLIDSPVYNFNSNVSDKPIPVITPGLAFDSQYNRLGRGGGFYDRFIRRNKNYIYTIGVCYSFQKIDTVPVDQSDEKINCLVSPLEILENKVI